MASFTERISVIIDVTTNKAVSGLKDFRSAVSEAQGFTGKLKAGVSSLGSTFGLAAAGPAALGAAVAGGAKIAFDAAQEWAALGEQVDNFATVTGFSYDAASRWIEVAGDLGVEASTLQSTLGKLNKAVNPEVFDKLGVSIAHTSSGAVDAAGTFENVLQKLRDIKDPTEQAQVAAKLLGRGWQSVAPLIARSAQDIKSQLEGVADVKVFTADEIKRSKEFKDKLRELDDKFTELKETVGQEVVPALTDAFGMIIKLADGMAWLDDQTQKLGFSLTDLELPNPAEWAWDWGWSQLEPVWNAFNREAPKISSSVAGLGDAAGMAARYIGLNKDEVADARTAYLRFHDGAIGAKNALKQLQDQIAGRADFIHLQQNLSSNAKAIKDLEKDFRDNKISAEEYYNGVASAALDSKAAVADYVSEVDAIPEEQKLELVASLDPASPGDIVSIIQRKLDTSQFYANVAGRLTLSPNTKQLMEGGIAASGGSTTNVKINVNVAPGGSPVETGRQIVNAINAYYRAGGNRLT